jgi:ABC-2 type transport system ATP-binding protein
MRREADHALLPYCEIDMPDPSSPAPSIVVQGVVKRFPGVLALASISADILPGRLTGLVGPDGAGKTTLMRLMAGLLRPSEGSISILGRDTVHDQGEIAHLAGYMPQRFGLYEDLSVMENLTLYAELRAMPSTQRKALFDRLLEFTRLGPFTSRLAGKLSGGMKQKLGVACALMARPPVLLLDEPGVGVDPVSRKDLWRMVAELTGEGMAVLWSTAYLDEAEQCDTVLLLNKGKLEFSGPPQELTRTLEGRSYRIVDPVGDRRHLLARALDLPSISDGAIQGHSVRLVTRADESIQAVRAMVAEAGTQVVSVAPRFEDAFVDLLGGGPGGTSAIAELMKPVQLASDIAVSCQNLTRRFGDFMATNHVSFDVRQGEIFGLLGPNGAGKSTTFKMLCGLLKPSEGSAHVVGLDLAKAASAAKNQLGYMAQKFSLYSLLSVRQNLEFSAGVYGLSGVDKKGRIDEMIDAFELNRFLDAAPDDLSLGYKQRLALACALMHRPPVLFLDEPTSGVDPITRREFWTHINGLVRKGATIMVTTHFMDEAEYCDRVALMYRGKLIALDTPDALKQQVVSHDGHEPTMEDAFIGLIERVDAEDKQ